jgi:hypothetical protein
MQVAGGTGGKTGADGHDIEACNEGAHSTTDGNADKEIDRRICL